MALPEELSHLKDKSTVLAAKAAFFNDEEIEHLVFVRKPLRLEEVASWLINADIKSIDKKRKLGEIIFLTPDRKKRTQIDSSSYILDSDYIYTVVIAPICLIQGDLHSEALQSAIEVDGLRLCKYCRAICGTSPSDLYLDPPHNYREGCREYCLGCWLVGDETACTNNRYVLTSASGELSEDYEEVIKLGYHLAVMPIARLHIDFGPIAFPGMVTFYPMGTVDLSSLNILPNQDKTRRLSELHSFKSGIDEETLESHPLVVFPCWFDWSDFEHGSHKAHLELIRNLSELVDQACLNLVRFRQCPIEPVHALPGRAGQTNSNHMMSGALLYNGHEDKSIIIGGDAFSHFVTRGAGLPLEHIECSEFPQEGEVGRVVNHALALYASMLEAHPSTNKFVQCMSLLEFLASPGQYQKWEKSSKILARYVAKNIQEYQKLLARMKELSGNKIDGVEKGFRTRIVHMGDRLDQVVPSISGRESLFLELSQYIGTVLKHMIARSELSIKDYEAIRDSLKPYDA